MFIGIECVADRSAYIRVDEIVYLHQQPGKDGLVEIGLRSGQTFFATESLQTLMEMIDQASGVVIG